MNYFPPIIRNALLIAIWSCCAAAAIVTAQQTQSPPSVEKTEAPPVQSLAPKKNARPAAANADASSAIEPYDNMSVEQMANKCVLLDTGAGAIEIELLPGAAPETVRNFLNLTAIGFFDATTFSRVVKGFVIQGGNITTRPTPAPALLRRASHTIPDEPNSIKHERGVVSMARSAAPQSATTNFFILLNAAPHLDARFAAFGRVVRGMDVVETINNAPTDGETPKQPVGIKRATVTQACAATVAPAATPSAPTPTATPSAPHK